MAVVDDISNTKHAIVDTKMPVGLKELSRNALYSKLVCPSRKLEKSLRTCLKMFGGSLVCVVHFKWQKIHDTVMNK